MTNDKLRIWKMALEAAAKVAEERRRDWDKRAEIAALHGEQENTARCQARASEALQLAADIRSLSPPSTPTGTVSDTGGEGHTLGPFIAAADEGGDGSVGFEWWNGQRYVFMDFEPGGVIRLLRGGEPATAGEELFTLGGRTDRAGPAAESLNAAFEWLAAPPADERVTDIAEEPGR